MAQVVDICELVVAWLRAFYPVSGISLYLIMQIVIWAGAAGVITWFTLDRLGGS